MRTAGFRRVLAAVGTVAMLVAAAALPVGAAPDEGPGSSFVNGVVRDEGTGVPIDGVQVCLFDTVDLSSGLCSTTDSTGEYSYANLLAGDYTLRAMPPATTLYLPVGMSLDGGYTPFPPIDVTLGDGQTVVQDIPLVLGGVLEITVTTPDGVTPAADEPVSLCRIDAPGEPGSCPQLISLPQTDASGQVTTMPLVPGEYRISAGYSNSPNGFPTAVVQEFVDPGVVNGVTLNLIGGGSLSGTVRDGDGNPLAGATVSIAIPPNLGNFNATTDVNGGYSFPSLQPGSYAGTVYPPAGGTYGTAATGSILITEGGSTTADFVLPRATAITGTASPGPVTGADGAAVLVCGGVATPVLSFPPSCSDGSPFGLVLVAPTATVPFFYTPPAPGTYTIRAAYYSGPTPLGASDSVTVTLAAGETETCTLVAGLLASPGSATCGGPPPPSPGTVVLTVDEPPVTAPLAGYYPGFCAAPGIPMLLSTFCSDGRPAVIEFGVQGGTSRTVTLAPGTYNAAMGNPQLSGLSPIGTVTVVSETTTFCTFTLAAGPDCSVDDGDGIAEPPAGLPADYDGNGDGIADAEQANVTTLLPAVGTDPVTIAAPAGATLVGVTAESVPASPPPPGAGSFPVGLLGFSVRLADGESTADVEIHLPTGTAPNAYYKLVAGAWAVAPATIAGDVVTLHLEDGDAFDTDPTVGVIGDPGGPAIVDLDPPTVTCPSDVHFALGQSGAEITATVTDAGSGAESPTVTVPVSTATAGSASVEVTGRDLAGNESTVSCGYTVDAPVEYAFQGFGWPVDNDRINVVKSGQQVPVSWRITAGGVGVSDPAAFGGFTSATIPCPAWPSDRVELTLPFSLPPRHVAGGVWLGTWRAPKAVPGGCVQMTLTLDDGSTHSAVFRIVK